MLITTDKSLIQHDIVIGYLNKSYWADNRPDSVIRKSIQNSLCFSMFIGDQQIGFARVVTDYAVFAYLADVFILPAFQGSGRGKLLVKTILEHDELQNIRKWTLATKDAHQLYSKFGFTELADPAKHMELKQPYPIESDD